MNKRFVSLCKLVYLCLNPLAKGFVFFCSLVYLCLKNSGRGFCFYLHTCLSLFKSLGRAFCFLLQPCLSLSEKLRQGLLFLFAYLFIFVLYAVAVKRPPAMRAARRRVLSMSGTWPEQATTKALAVRAAKRAVSRATTALRMMTIQSSGVSFMEVKS